MPPELCEHGDTTFDTHLYPMMVRCKAKCNECGIKLTADFALADVNIDNGLNTLQNIENKMRQAMSRAAAERRRK